MTHAYAAPGTYRVRVTATDGVGNPRSVTRTVQVEPAGVALDRTAPVLTGVRLTPNRLPTGHGAGLRVTSTERAQLRGLVERRKRNGDWLRMGTKSWRIAAGVNSRTFYGKTAQRRLKTGSYRVRLVATDTALNPSAPVTLRFRVDRTRRVADDPGERSKSSGSRRVGW